MSVDASGRRHTFLAALPWLAGFLYLVVLASAPVWLEWVLAGFAVAVLASALGLALRGDSAAALLSAWPGLHFAILASGSLTSPLLPLSLLWVWGLVSWLPQLRWPGVAVIAGTVPIAHLSLDASPATGVLASFAALVAVAVVFAVFTTPLPVARVEPALEPLGLPEPGVEGEDPAAVVHGALEVIRLATAADETVFWQKVGDGERLRRVGRASVREEEPPPEEVKLAGHPFGWAVSEGVHVRLEKGAKELPSAWASEMLLVPLESPVGLLAMAFRGAMPSWAEGAAFSGAAHLGRTLSLLGTRRLLELLEGRFQAVTEAVRHLPGELDTRRFAELLADAVLKSTGAAGAAVASWDDDAQRGRVLYHAPGDERGEGAGFGGGESRLALALKHKTPLAFDDLRSEKDGVPLLAPGERLRPAPRAALVAPMLAGERAVGAVAAWHTEHARFGDADREFFELLRGLVSIPFRNALDYAELDRAASTDSLTGLANRATFERRFAALQSHFERYARPLGVVVADIDHFKEFNDSWGHEQGDEVLREVGRVLRSEVREVDLSARLGGEEFVILLPETGLAAAAEVAERVRQAVEHSPVSRGGSLLRVTVSLGAASCPESVARPAGLLSAADTAMYASKAAGRNRVTRATP